MGVWSLLLLSVGAVSVVHGAIDADRVTDLPGLGSYKPNFKHYSGYLKATGSKRLHYWFVESQNEPAKDPLVLWLNGGPGCSSLDGLLSEHGPFLASTDGKHLVENHYSWNKVANILYLEAPAGVGFSYSLNKNYTTSDDQVSLDNYSALKYFLQNYPEFSANDFYVTGESYGGIYVPTLSVRVLDDRSFNFKGFAVGNGISNYVMNQNSLVFFANYHGLIGQDLWSQLLKFCCKGVRDPVQECDFAESTDPKCNNAFNEYQVLLAGLNIYDLYAECHTDGSVQARKDPNTVWLNPVDFLFPERDGGKRRQSLLHSMRHEGVLTCINVSGITTYLNNKDVRHALHIPDFVPTWEICSGVVSGLYQRNYRDMTEQYMKVLSTKRHRTMVYNGDTDMACNFLGDEWFVDSLKQPVKKKWQPWHYLSSMDQSRQIAGFTKQFENLSFVTIKGAGHMVPQVKPNPALVMFTSFLKGEM